MSMTVRNCVSITRPAVDTGGQKDALSHYEMNKYQNVQPIQKSISSVDFILECFPPGVKTLVDCMEDK